MLDGTVLTFSRDENINRPLAIPPKVYKQFGKKMVFPQDPISNGSWIIADENGTIACLLNGAFVKHERKESYAKSRGLVLLDFFRYASIPEFLDSYTFFNIEPFTMIVVNNGIHEIRWTGREISYKKLSENCPHIWSSATLYSEEISEKRNTWFKKWLSECETIDGEQTRQFHHQAGEGNPLIDLKMKRGDIRTLSITTIHSTENEVQLSYEDLRVNGSHDTVSLAIKKDAVHG